jgi:APA family basic amino acid/polyamine antiporter
VVAIALQGVMAAVIALSGAYDEILSYVVAMDAVFFGLTGAALLVFRARERRGTATRPATGARMPGHPYTTLLFTLAFWLLALTTIAQFPRSAGVGVLIMLAGVPAYLLWRRLAPATGGPG